MRKIVFVLLAIGVCITFASLGMAADHTIKIATKAEVGKYLTDGAGKTLYWFKKDSPGKSECSGGCVQNWPVFYSEKIMPEPGCEAADFGAITRADGAKQTTFKGYPLYYFKNDSKPGDTMGQGVKEVWFVINPDKFPVK